MDINSITEIARFLTDEAAAQQALADLRWPNGVTCPHKECEGGKPVYEVKYVRRDARSKEVKPTVRKQWKCGSCRRKFSVTTGSIFEGAHIPVGKWIYGVYMMATSKKGVSANQIAGQIGVSVKSAWFMMHRVREAMLQEPLASLLGSGPDPIVELDETFVGGRKRNNRHASRTSQAGRKTAVMTLIDREGDVRTVKVPNVRKATLQAIAKPIVDRSANIVTDSHLAYSGLDEYFHSHHRVDHSKTFVRGIILHTNFAESYHSLLKRGIIGIYHHVSAKHLDRYLVEFDRRWNTRKATGGERAVSILKTAVGQRLRYSELVA